MDGPSQPIETEEPDVVRPITPEESMSEAVLDAFRGNGIDVLENETTLHDEIDPDALNRLGWESDGTLRVGFSLWSHRVVLTSEEVRLYNFHEDITPDRGRCD